MAKDAYTAKAGSEKNYRIRNGIATGVVGALSCAGLVLMVYSLITKAYLFAASYFLAIILGFTYVAIKVNTVWGVYAAIDRTRLYMKNWENDFMPYAADFPVAVLREFIPARKKLVVIPVKEITRLMVGTKNFIKRYTEDMPKFRTAVAKYEKSRDYYRKKVMQTTDFLYVETVDGDAFYMPVTNFDGNDLYEVVKEFSSLNPGAELSLNSRHYKKLRNRARREK